MDDALGSLQRVLDDDPLVVGIGNPLRGDDGLGPVLARRLAEKSGVGFVDAGSTPENQIGPIVRSGARRVLLVDAVDLRQEAGEWALLAPDELMETGSSTHNPSLGLVSEILREAGIGRVLLLGVQPGQTNLGAGLSHRVRRGIRRLVAGVAGSQHRSGEDRLAVDGRTGG